MPESQTYLKGLWVLRNYKELVNFGKVQISLKSQVLSTMMSKLISVKSPIFITIPSVQPFRRNSSRSRQNRRRYEDDFPPPVKEISVPVNIVQILLGVSARPLAKASSKVSACEDPMPE